MNSVFISCQDTIKTRTEDELTPIKFTSKLKELQQYSTVYFKFDSTRLQRKEITKSNHGEITTYYYEISSNKYLSLRHSTYKNFDAFEKGEKMITKKSPNDNFKNIIIIDINFILDNGLKETYFAIRDKKYFLIDESLGLDNQNNFFVFEVVLSSSYDF